MILGRNKKAIEILVEGQPPQKALIVTSKAGPGLIKRLTVLVSQLLRLGNRVFGVGVAGMGAAHFVAPKPFEAISKVAFPEDTRRWVYQNGGTELLLGLALTFPRTRVLGYIGGTAYVAFLGSRVIGNINR